jgi:hypothetical protein
MVDFLLEVVVVGVDLQLLTLKSVRILQQHDL